uniref:Gamma-secretase activating protein n=1 Tax=Ornithorhynchus anatinus TaxID=9258 RepID=A0A6I8NRQ4_ORNAN
MTSDSQARALSTEPRCFSTRRRAWGGMGEEVRVCVFGRFGGEAWRKGGAGGGVSPGAGRARGGCGSGAGGPGGPGGLGGLGGRWRRSSGLAPGESESEMCGPCRLPLPPAPCPMELQLSASFELRRDVAPRLEAAMAGGPGGAVTFKTNSETLRVVNVERDGTIIYTWKDSERNVHFGLYDLQTKQNEHLYVFERDLQVISCSVNSEKTLLAISFSQSIQERRINELQPVSKCLTLLVEINPLNNVKVLKAVDSRIWVQVKSNSSPLPRDRVVEDFAWAQWEMSEQRLFYIIPMQSRSILKCIQFYPDEIFDIIFEVPLDISLSDTGLKLVNFGPDYSQDPETGCKQQNLRVFTHQTGSLCVCYSQPSGSRLEATYVLFYIDKGYSKTFTVALQSSDPQPTQEVTFLNLGFYVAACLPGHFLHLLNIQHPELLCYSLFGTDVPGATNGPSLGSLQPLAEGMMLDWDSGRLVRVSLSEASLLQFLWDSKRDWERLAALHGLLSCCRNHKKLEAQIVHWILENLSACQGFDPIQEFIIASLYWRACAKTRNIDRLLPYSSLLHWNTEIPGIACVTEDISLPLMKMRSFRGYWEKLNGNLECVRCAGPCLRYNNNALRREWDRLLLEESGWMMPTLKPRNDLEMAKRVLSRLEARDPEQSLAPLFQEEDSHQRMLMGQMVTELSHHLLRHGQQVGKQEVGQMALDYVAKLLGLVGHLVDASWRKHNLCPGAPQCTGRGGMEEAAVFHTMTRILGAAVEMCLPLPPGFHTLHLVLGVRCLPLPILLHYLDGGILRLTETGVTRLLKDLDNSEKNEQLKFSIVARLPPSLVPKVSQLWDHPTSSNIIARKHVQLLLQKFGAHRPRPAVIDKSLYEVEFLPLNYLARMLAEMEVGDQVLNPREDQDHVDARFVEEAALKETTMILGL